MMPALNGLNGVISSVPSHLTPSTNPEGYSLTARSPLHPQSSVSTPLLNPESPACPSEMNMSEQAGYFALVPSHPNAVLNATPSMASSNPTVTTLRGPGFDPPPNSNVQAEKAKSSYNVLESVLSALKPAVQDNAPFAIPDRQHHAGVLEQAMTDFRENFLLVQPTPAPEETKNEKKRPLPNEAAALPPQQPPNKTIRHRYSESLQERPQMPPFNHTQSSPILPVGSHFQPTEVATASFVVGPMSNTPGADATIAGIHLPLSTGSASVTNVSQLQQASQAANMPLNSINTQEILNQSRPPTPLSGFQEMMDNRLVHSTPSSPSALRSITQPTPASPAPMNLAPSYPLPFSELPRQPANPRSLLHLDMTASGSATIKEEILSPVDGTPLRGHTSHHSWSEMAEAFERSEATKGRSRAATIGSMTLDSPPVTISPDDSGLNLGGQADPLPIEIKEHMDAIFVEWLEALCNDLNATDSKGETIHQTLMAKKMQKLDEAGEYRPFRFRIQAFTNRFAEELAKHGLQDISNKVIRQYLWSQPLISRFNDEGRKAKSRGNHVWSVDAKRIGEHNWHFRPFHRRIPLPGSRAAREGQLWSWEARVWDPQASVVPANFSTPNLPSWLSWRHSSVSGMISLLSGTPPVGSLGQADTTYHIEVEAYVEGSSQPLSTSFDLQVTPASDGQHSGMISDLSNQHQLVANAAGMQNASPGLSASTSSLTASNGSMAASTMSLSASTASFLSEQAQYIHQDMLSNPSCVVTDFYGQDVSALNTPLLGQPATLMSQEGTFSFAANPNTQNMATIAGTLLHPHDMSTENHGSDQLVGFHGEAPNSFMTR